MSEARAAGRASGADALPDGPRTLLTGLLAPAGATPWPPVAAPPEAFYAARPSPPSLRSGGEASSLESLGRELALGRRGADPSSLDSLDSARAKSFFNIPDAASPREYQPRVLPIGSAQPLLDTSGSEDLLEHIEQVRRDGFDSIMCGLESGIDEGESFE